MVLPFICMSSLFSSDAMAEGYARDRPAVHPWVIAQVRDRMRNPAKRALDVGCGAGLSTAALYKTAGHCVGVEPAEAMLGWTRQVAPNADFAVGRAEQLPFAAGAFDLITAAGSLNYCDLAPALREIIRVMTIDGALVVYDFSQGKDFADSPALDEWHARFKSRYPAPESGPKLEAGGAPFSMSLPFTADSYLRYAMTETNVSNAIARGISVSEIRDWCSTELEQAFNGQTRQVVFKGYIAIKSKRAINDWLRRLA